MTNVFCSFAQKGYFYNGNFIELIPEENELIALSQEQLSGDNYHHDASFACRTKDNKEVYILSTIILKLKSRTDINNILKTYKDKLSIKKQRGQIFYLDCNVKSSDEIFEIVKHLTNDKNVIWCEPDMVSGQNFNNNPLYGNQFYLKNTVQFGGIRGIDINVEPAWKLIKGKPFVKVAVIDCGVDLVHEDLYENIELGYTVNNPTGYGAPQNWNSYFNKAHGTACAGIIGALDNNIGIVGVANGVKIVPVNIQPSMPKYETDQGFASISEIADAIVWAYEHADILSCSWGSVTPSNIIREAINEALTKGRNGKGCIVVVASGNESKDSYIAPVCFPATIDGVIAVGAMDRYGNICSYSCQGKELSVVAPSNDIYTTDISGEPGFNGSNYYFYFNGTSAACPQVAGVAALMLSANNTLRANEVKDIIQKSARDRGVEGRDNTFGYGLVNAYSSVLYALAYKGMSIIGPNVIEKAGTYSISNLVPGCTVKWSQSPIPGSLNNSYVSLRQSTTDPNSVYIENYFDQGFSIQLKATVVFPEETGIPSQALPPINVTGDGKLTGLYYERYPDGSQSSEWTLLDTEYDETNTASPGSIVNVTSDNFRNRVVTYRYSNETYGVSERNVQVQDNKIWFEMPNIPSDKSLIFTVSGGGISTTHNFIFKAENTNSTFDMNLTNRTKGNIEIEIGKNFIGKGGTSSSNQKWDIVIVDLLTNKETIRKTLNENTFSTTLVPGLYIVKATKGNHSVSKTIKIK